MNTLIISSSLSPNSRSWILCSHVAKLLSENEVNVTLVDARTMELHPCHKELTPSMEDLQEKVRQADNIILGMGVHCYSMNDALKIIFDTCMKEAEGKFFGVLCAAGGERSYLATQHVTQICMNEWRMMQLPRIVYATGKDFHGQDIVSQEILERCSVFADEFAGIGKKLLAE